MRQIWRFVLHVLHYHLTSKGIATNPSFYWLLNLQTLEPYCFRQYLCEFKECPTYVMSLILVICSTMSVLFVLNVDLKKRLSCCVFPLYGVIQIRCSRPSIHPCILGTMWYIRHMMSKQPVVGGKYEGNYHILLLQLYVSILEKTKQI